MNEFCKNIFSIIKGCLPVNTGKISLHEPCFNGNEWDYVKKCLDTTMVSSVGEFVNKFEFMLSEFTGLKYAIAAVNGTAALHICLKLAGVQSGDEVLTPALTFVATANAVYYCGAIPHFVDSEEKTLGIDPEKLKLYLKDISEFKDNICYNRTTGRPIRAILPMHTFGHPVDLEPLVAICEEYNIAMIEDATESIGSYYKGKHTGNWGQLSALSFNGNKTITTGGGGAILTNDDSLAKLAKHITTTARLPHKWGFDHDMVGYNYRLPNINAALGCAQLEQLPEFLRKKRELANRYRMAFKGVKGVKFFIEPEFAKSNYWLNSIILDNDYKDERDNLLELTNSNSIMTRPAWTLMNELKIFKNCPMMDLSIAENIETRLINIPSSAFL